MSDPIIEAAARALQEAHEWSSFWDAREARLLSRAMLTAVTPLILEQAAQVADDEDGQFSYAGEHRNMAMLQQHGYEIAAAIRALKVS